MSVKILNWDNDSVGEMQLDPAVFDIDETPGLLNLVVKWCLARRRAGTHSSLGRGEVRGSTRKIYRQKGTGRARHGGIRAPQFRGGGAVFGPKPRSYDFKLNKKVRAKALKIALSLKLRENKIIVLESCDISSHKTSILAASLNNLGLRKTLIIDTEIRKNLKLAASNIHDVDLLPTCGMNVYDILRSEYLVLSVAAIEKIYERFLCH